MALTIETAGRRIYVLGDTYPIRDMLREAGCRWDPERRAWWGGATKREALDALVASMGSASAQPQASEPRREAPGIGATVAGRAEYKGRTYYVAGRVVRGRTHWDDEVAPVASRDGSRVLLYFRDGSSSFWAAADAVRVAKRYQRPTTIQRLRDYAEQAKSYGTDECRCRCHHEPNAGAPGSTLYDGCDRCGCEAC